MNAYGPILIRSSSSAGQLVPKAAVKKCSSSTSIRIPIVISKKPRPLPTFNLSELPPEIVKRGIVPLMASKFILLNKQFQRMVLDLMVSNPYHYNHNDLLYNYVKHNNLTVVENILNKSTTVNPSAKRNKIIREAICNGNIEILQLLIEHPKFSCSTPIWDVENGNFVKNFNMVDYAAKQNQSEITKLLMEEHTYLLEHKDTFKKILRYAVKNNNVELMRYIINKPNQKPAIRCSKSEEILIPMPLPARRSAEDLYGSTIKPPTTSTYTYRKPVDPKFETLVEDEESTKLLRIVAKSGNTDVLKELIRQFKYNIDTVYEVAEIAAHEGHIGIIKTVVEKFDIEPAHEKNKILRIACLNGHAALAKFLFQYPNVTYFRGEILNIFADCCRSDREDCQVISILITQMNINLVDEIEPRYFFCDLRKQGRLKVLTLLQTYFTQGKAGCRPLHLGGPRLKPAELKMLLLDTVNIKHNDLLLDFIESGDADFVKLILRNSPIVKPSANNNNALKQAILCNNSEMVKILIGHSKIELKVPISDKSRMIDGIDQFSILGYAVVANRPQIVKEILNLNKKQIDISEQNNFALRMAVKFNNIDLAKILLKFPHPALYNDSSDNPLNLAVENNNPEMILLLARDKRFTELLNPTGKVMTKAIETAAQFGHVTAVKLLVDVCGVDPGSCRNDALKIAVTNALHIDVVKLLLSYQQVRDNKKKVFNAFLTGCASGNHEIVALFMKVIDHNEVVLKSRTLLKELKKRKLWHVIDVLMTDSKFRTNSPFVW